MKRLFILTALACCFFIGCEGGLPPEESICAKMEGYSWICEVTAERGTTPEDLEGIVLDAVAVQAIFRKDWDQKKTDELVAWTRKMDGYVDRPQMTFNELIGLVDLDAQKSALLLSIISRRLPWFKSGLVLPEKDRYMLHIHFRHIREMFGVYDPIG
jgi:hypothetical protein